MKPIIINGDYLTFKTFGGVCRHITEILKELDNIIIDEQIFLVTPLYAINTPCFNKIKIVKYGNHRLGIWKQLDFPRYVKKVGGIGVDFSQAFPLCGSDITCVYDCIPERQKNDNEDLIIKYIKKIKLIQRSIAIKKSKMIITISNDSKKDINFFYKINLQKILVIPCAWQHIESIEEDISIFTKIKQLEYNNYFFMLGSRVPQKNTKWILNAAEQNPKYIFVIAGENKYDKTFNERKQTIPSNVIYTGYISDEEMKALMAHCRAFILPSLIEGFGIPPLEALSLNREIIISDIPIFKEIYEKSAHYINPKNYSDIDIDRILKTSTYGKEIVLNKYSWKKSAKMFIEICRKRI